MKASRRGSAGGAGSCPSIREGIVSTAGVENAEAIPVTTSAPDNHFGAGPDCRVIPPGFGRVVGGGRCPTVSARVISSAGV